MSTLPKITTNVYLYDPLDRLVNAHSTQQFYNETRIATEIQGEQKTSFFEYEAMPLAELHPGDSVTLLATDLQTSVLDSISSTLRQPQAYSPYGHRPAVSGLQALQGFNGERIDTLTGHYLLGNGYRVFNPVLMRFNSPDELSPFDRGGMNSYAYCSNDPMNKKDPSGYFSISSLFKPFTSLKKQYYTLESKARSRAASPLKNRGKRPSVIHSEDIMRDEFMAKNLMTITIVKSKKDLAIVNKKELLHKYILTKDNTLLLSSISKQFAIKNPDLSVVYPSHASLARYLAWGGMNAEVVSAGSLTKIKGGYQATNISGHYKPTAERVTLVKFKLRSKGVNATSRIIDFAAQIRK
ncbi:RHS repeat-associated core domain-containing protein [Pseudomonas sp. SIMBA_077]